jgi:ribosomal protein L12E/L44/L45/RPP1/RPP2
MSNNEEKVNCPCGSVVFQKNMNSHCKTKKHQLVCGSLEQIAVATARSAGGAGAVPTRSKSQKVNFAAAQKTQNAAEDEEEDEISEDDEQDELEEGGFEDDCMDALEDIGKMLQSQNSANVGLRNVVLDIRSKLESLMERLSNIEEILEEQKKANLPVPRASYPLRETEGAAPAKQGGAATQQ